MKQAGLDLNLRMGREFGWKQRKTSVFREGTPTRMLTQEAPGGEKAFRVVLPHLVSLQVQVLQLLPCPQLASFFASLSSLELKAALPFKIVNPGL